MADKIFDQRVLHKLLLALAICSTIGLLLFFLRSGSGNASFNFNNVLLRGFSGNFNSNEQPSEKVLLGGLLTSAFDEESCLSRYQSASYWKSSDHKPSPYLLDKLRAYETLHKRCGPYTDLYNKSIEMLRSNNRSSSDHELIMECNYVVWIAEAGLGNRMIAIVSAFLYALLNNKILLLSYEEDYKDLFCEPFPDTTWVLPSDFPIQNFRKFWGDHAPQSFGKLLKDKVIDIDMNSRRRNSTAAPPPPFSYIHIMHDSNDQDRMFFCDGAQDLLREVPWLLIRANNYYAPGFFLVPQYQEELDRLFPEKDAVFHHLGRYLLHPTNSVWGFIVRYYNAYLANAKLRLGIQIRNLPFAPASFEDRLSQVMNCTLDEHLLPGINLNESAVQRMMGEDQKPKAVLVASLNPKYYEWIKGVYYEHPTLNGELIGVFQPSHEEHQQTSRRSHNVKALSDIYLLSFSDLLVTTELSTFGYVAYGLAGLKPWLVGNRKAWCRKAMSMEPCFLNPPHLDCKTLEFRDPASVVPNLRRCEDPWGIKLFN